MTEVLALLERLVRIESVNPALDPGGAGEAGAVAAELRDLDLHPDTPDEWVPVDEVHRAVE